MPVANGGTGAATAAGALSNLGAQKRVTGSCVGGALSAIAADGTVACLQKRRIIAPAALPVASDGDEVDYVADVQRGVVWRLRYDATATSLDGGLPNAWEFVGGAALLAEVPDSYSNPSPTYTVGIPAGPTVTVPLAGEYSVDLGFTGNVDLTSATTPSPYVVAFMSVNVAGAQAADAEAVYLQNTVGKGIAASVARSMIRSLPPGPLAAQYRMGSSDIAATASWSNRWLKVQPVRVH